MARKNIFEQLCDFNFTQELYNIDELIHLRIVGGGRFSKYDRATIEDLVDTQLHVWAGRATGVSCSDIRRKLNIDKILSAKKIEVEEGITYLEYALNIINQFGRHFDDLTEYKQIRILAFENCKQIIEKLGLMLIHDESIDTYILVPKNQEAIAAAELLPEETGNLVMKYHHHLLKGDLQKKSDILRAMGMKYEPLGKRMKSSNQGDLDRDIGFCLNRLNIRHNNKEGNKPFLPVIGMSDNELEKWYDRTYDLLLLGFTYHDYLINNKIQVNELRKS